MCMKKFAKENELSAPVRHSEGINSTNGFQEWNPQKGNA